MSESRFEKLQRLFHAATDVPAAERGAWADDAAGGDPDVLIELKAMLRTAESSPLNVPIMKPVVPSSAAISLEGRSIGPYRLVHRIGEGGFGEVYQAEQSAPVRRRVAIKIVKAGMDSAAVVRRFEAERQALAVMDHPCIAKVFDGGVVPDGVPGAGRPYFVMEYADGRPITTYCDEYRLTVAQRLGLFMTVCEAVQHAHIKGIIHRDIKPSNILVDTQGDKPVPKIIDFGIAKALSGKLGEQTIITEHGVMIGTPEYMSPEQAEMGVKDIDTRTDVYSLGVVLYELLTGAVPFSSRSLRAVGLAAIQKMICEQEPPRPSTRLSTLGDASQAVAAARQARLEDLSSQLRRELEWIPLKALRKDRTERYRSASELADDVANYLAHRPLIAGPESPAYKARKFLRRNKAAVVAMGTIAATLVLASGVSVWFGLRESAARLREAEQRTRADERAAAATKAEGEARAAQAAEKNRADELKLVSDFQESMLDQIDPTTAGVRLTEDVTRRLDAALEKAGITEQQRTAHADAFRQQWVRVNATDAALTLIDETILKPAVKAIDEQFKDQPVVDAQLRQVLAYRYRDLGLYDGALPLQTSALEIRRRVLGEEHPDTLNSIYNMGVLLRHQGKFGEAEPYLREAMEIRRRVLGEDHLDTLDSINSLAVFLVNVRGKLGEAERYHREALEKFRRVLGEDHPDTLNAIQNMGVLLRDQGKLGEAEQYLREAMEKSRRVSGEDHPMTLPSIFNVGSLLQAQGKLSEAEPYYREVLEKCRRVHGETHPDTFRSIYSLGFLLREQGKLDEAEPYLREALNVSRRTLGEEHPDTLRSITIMGHLLREQGKLGEAEPYLREALAKNRRVLGEEHSDTLAAINNMGTLLRDQGKLDEAEHYLSEALEKDKRMLGEEHLDTLRSINSLSGLLRAQGKHNDAVALLTPAEPAARRVFTDGHVPRLALFLTTLGRARVGMGYDPERFALAETNLLEAYPIFIQERGDKHKDTLGCVNGLVDLYTAWEVAEPGKGHETKAVEWKAKLGAIN